jgi:tripartite-type tricarboxylate transporter receptor subunit TctC
METALKLLRCAIVAACVLVGLCATHAFAQSDYPNKSIRLVVGFTAGGISDVLARALGARVSAQVGQQVVVDNRAGAGTTIAAEIVAKSPPDGYTLFMQDMTTQAINASLYKKLPYDTVKDFTPITLVASSPLMLVVHPSLPVKSIKELIALGKSKPGQIPFASSGNGTILHLAAETFKTMAGIDMIHVPYKGSAQAVQALLAGEVAVTFSTMPPALTNVKAGRLRALGVTTPKRNAAAPEVPTIAEGGLKGFDVVLYSGVLGPARLPAAIVNKLNAEFIKAVNAPEVKTVYASLGVDAITDTPAEFAVHIAADIDKLGKAVRASGAHAD